MKPSRRRAIPAGIALLLVLSTLALYAPAIGFDFVHFDDVRYVVDNREVHRGLGSDTLAWALTTDHMGTWHPLTWISHAVDASMYGTHPAGHHATSIVLHALNALLLFAVALRITRRPWPSAALALLFAVHPLNVASVAWVASRKGVLSTSFLLLAVLAYLHYVERPTVRRRLWVVLACALGLLSKPMVVTLPLLLLLLDVTVLDRLAWNGRARGDARPWREKLPLFAMSAAVAIVVFAVRRTGEPVPLGDRLAQAPLACLIYLRRAVWPSDLATPYPALETPSLTAALLASAALVALTVVALRVGRRHPCVTLGWLWFLVTLAPVLGFVQVGDQLMADRWMYVPLLGLGAAVVFGLADVVPKTKAASVTAGLATLMALAALTVTARTQIMTWRDSETLFTRAIEVTSANRIAHYNLGWYLADRGRPNEAIEHYRRAIAAAPGYFAARYNLALLLWDEGRVDAARNATCEALRFGAADHPTHRAHLEARLGDFACPATGSAGER